MTIRGQNENSDKWPRRRKKGPREEKCMVRVHSDMYGIWNAKVVCVGPIMDIVVMIVASATSCRSKSIKRDCYHIHIRDS